MINFYRVLAIVYDLFVTKTKVWTTVSRGLSRVSVTADQSERQGTVQRPMCHNTDRRNPETAHLTHVIKSL